MPRAPLLFRRPLPIPATTSTDPFATSHRPRGVHLQHTSPKGPRVTAREREVLLLLIDGQTTRQIAHALSLKPTTVRTYLQRLYRKTHTATRAALVWWWAHYDGKRNPKTF